MAEHGFRRWIITITVITAALLELIDTTIVNVALPNIMGNLGATLEDANWIVTGYAVANVIILPMSGWLGDRFGRKNYFLAQQCFAVLCDVEQRSALTVFKLSDLPISRFIHKPRATA